MPIQNLLREEFEKKGSIYSIASKPFSPTKVPLVINFDPENVIVNVTVLVRHSESVRESLRRWEFDSHAFLSKHLVPTQEEGLFRMRLPNFAEIEFQSKKLYRKLRSNKNKNIWPTVGEHRLSDFYFGIDFCAKIC